MLFWTSPARGWIPQTRLLWEIIRDYNKLGKHRRRPRITWTKRTLCERLAIIDHGRIIAQGTPAELKGAIPGGYALRFDRVTEELLAELRKLPVTEVRRIDGQFLG